MKADECILDLLNSDKLNVYVLCPVEVNFTKDLLHSDTKRVVDGPLVLNFYLQKLGLLINSDVIIETVTGNLYYVSNNQYCGENDGVIISLIDTTNWKPRPLVLPDLSVKYSEDTLYEYKHFNHISLVLEIANVPALWWGMPVHERLIGNLLDGTQPHITAIYHSPHEAFEKVEQREIVIRDYQPEALEIEINDMRFYMKEVKVSNDTLNKLMNLQLMLTFEKPVAIPNVLALDDKILIMRDVQTNRIYTSVLG